MSSAGASGVVLVVARDLQAKDGRFAVCGLNDEVKELFEVSGFSLIVNIVADRGARWLRFRATEVSAAGRERPPRTR